MHALPRPRPEATPIPPVPLARAGRQRLPVFAHVVERCPHWGTKPERVEDWLTLLELRYTLTAAAAGTRLERQTVWRRHLAPAFYFGWLQQRIITGGQQRLLEFVRARVRANDAALPVARR